MYLQNDIDKIFNFSPAAQDREIIRSGTTGFSSPAEDYAAECIDLITELNLKKASIFPMSMGSDAMEPLICEKEVLIVDRSMSYHSGDIIVARIGSVLVIREFRKETGRIALIAVNPNYPPIPVIEETDYECWGRVIWSLKGHYGRYRVNRL